MVYRKKNSNGNEVINDNVELITDQQIESVSTKEFDREIAEEAFMNEPVTVLLADTNDDSAPTHGVFSVNGTNQPILRGVPTVIKRKYLEVIARCKETKYNQRTANPMEPDRIEMVQRTAFAYPFQVVEDKNPKGRAWLAAVMADPA
jgi:hypothetical protein